MKRVFYLSFLLVMLSFAARAQEFDDYFENKTLRVDYIFSGNADAQHISVDRLIRLPQWAGRKHRLAELPLEGNGQIEMRDSETGRVIYRNSFSTLFQEWLTTEEAGSVSRSFENTYLMPFPKKPAEIHLTLRNNRQEVITTFSHPIRPDDILIRQAGENQVTPHRTLVQNGSPETCIDLVILAEGYTANEMEQFYKDAQTATESLFAHEPFRELKSRFNVTAVESVSNDSGVSTPGKGIWKNTAFDSHFNTFYSDRYLTTNNVSAIHDVLSGIPYEHIIVLANTDEYGGGGIYNAFTLTTAHHKDFKPVVVHEFGHSFGGLADEYFYEGDLFSDTYPSDKEPWEQNITTLVDFGSKWKDLVPAKAPIPTDPKQFKKFPVGVYEGAGYSAKGIYRPSIDCRMKSNPAEEFCPVCQRALKRLIDFYTDH